VGGGSGTGKSMFMDIMEIPARVSAYVHSGDWGARPEYAIIACSD
jgi:hypothetical protein